MRSDAVSRYVERRAALLSRGTVGAGPRRSLTETTDALLADLFVHSGAATTGAVLVAVGGLGRRELAPGSDLDLLLLHPAAADSDGVQVAADRLWYPLWDLGVRLDHSVRTPAQTRRLAAQDLKVLLGLLDARVVAGDAVLLAELRESVLADWRAAARRRLPELHDAVQERKTPCGELAHLLEPDLKDSHGGLRDLVALRAVAASWVTDAPVALLRRPHALLLDVRDALHLTTGRPVDRLHQQEQPAVARLLGFSDDDILLRAVSSAGRTVAVASERVWHRVGRAQRPVRLADPRQVRRLGSRPAPRAPLADGVVAQDGEVVLARDGRPDRDAGLVLRAAAAAAQAGLRLAPHAVERLAVRSAPVPEPWPAAARDALVSLLGAGRAAVPVWEALDQVGVWSRLLPGWEVVRSAPQRNPVHRFTVDRHLLETAVAAAPLVREVSRPDLLLVGALLHDLGKGRSGDHTEVGMELVAELAPRLGYDSSDTETLVRLVEHHLLLPEVATRRDLDDPATVAAVANAARTPEFLDLLHALTRADAAATGPAAWSDWKEALVADLVRRVRGALGLPVDPTRGPGTPPEPAELAPLLAAASPSDVQVVWQRREPDSVARLVVAAPDRVGLLAAVAGVLALHRLEVRAARVDTVRTAAGPRAVQSWTVVPTYGEPPPVERVREDLVRTLDGRLDLSARLRVRDEARRTESVPPPRIAVVPGASARATVLEVRAHDAPGLLHHVARALADRSVAVATAQVSTLGSEAVDVFYVVEQSGAPLRTQRCDEVVAAVASALEVPEPS